MRLVVVSHKVLRRARDGSYATDGGFPMQMSTIAGLFDRTTVCAPVSDEPARPGDVALAPELRVAPVSVPRGSGTLRKLLLPVWFIRSGLTLVREIRRADGVHAPIPGDVGTIGIVVAEVLRKPLFVRHCGNWLAPRTPAEHLWKRYMERRAGGRIVMLATGDGDASPSRNPAVRWIFSTSLTEDECKRVGRRRTLPSDRGARLAIACRQVEAKGTGVVIEALRVLGDAAPKLSLLVIGDGPDRHQFEAQAAHADVADRVEFTGQVDHEGVLSQLDSVDLFVFPTTSSEGFPKAVAEALALGLPVVATPVSVLPTLLGAGCGVVVDTASPQLVADAIMALLRDPRRYADMSEQALKAATSLTLEGWQAAIQSVLEPAWGPLHSGADAPRSRVAP